MQRNLKTTKYVNIVNFKVSNRKKLNSVSKSHTKIGIKNNNEVIHVSEVTKNFISFSQMMKYGNTLLFGKENGCRINRTKVIIEREHVFTNIQPEGDLYKLSRPLHSVNYLHISNIHKLYYRQLCHINRVCLSKIII